MEKTFKLSTDDIMRIFQAGARFGYSQRSKMAGAKGTNEPDFATFMLSFPENIKREYESPDDIAARLNM